MHITKKFKRLYLPAFSIVAIVLLLLILISISTYRNFYRDRRTTMDFLYRQGIGLLHSLEAGVMIGLTTLKGIDSIGAIIGEIAKSEDIAYIYLINPKGEITYHSDPTLISSYSQRPDLLAAQNGILYRVRQLSEDLKVYEISKAFSSFPYNKSTQNLNESVAEDSPISNNPSDNIIVLGMKMTKFEDAQRSDLHHAVIMAAILVALGAGVIFFIFVIQNYYLVNKTLKETQDYTQQVVANMANGLLSVNSAGEVASYNQLALDLLGLEERDVMGKDLREIMDFEAAGVSETLTNSRSVLDRELNYKLKSKEIIPLSVSVTPILTEDRQISGAVILLRDLREIKRLQEKIRHSEKFAAIGELAAGVAHEIRNPLSSIKGFAQFLRHSLKDQQEEREYATVMVHEIDRINRVVTDLLIYARPLIVKQKKEDLMPLISHAISLVNADAQARQVTIRQNLSDDLDSIWIDANQLIHALLNLLLNSLEAVSEGGEIEIGAKLEETAIQHLNLWVEDDGIGVPKDDLEKLIDPFFTTRKKGTGLGLAIVKKIVENHQGELSIESPPHGKNCGTRVSLYIPQPSSYKEEEDNDTKNISS